MNIHEYQARELLTQFGVPVPPGVVVQNPMEAEKAFNSLAKREGAKAVVVKAQVHAGGRGKGGGIKIVSSPEEARKAASDILSKPLVTPQTRPEGVLVNRLLIASAIDIAKEYYLGMVVDRIQGCPVVIASSEGGMDIEEVAASNPDAIIREPISPIIGLRPYQARKIAYRLGLSGQQVRMAGKIMQQMADLFLKMDASLVEINPLVVTKATDEHPDGVVLALDCKMTFDENALFRQDEIKNFADPTEEDPAEVRARQFGLSYVNLDGNIGCLVNGAGLAMSTMDIIKLHGGEPANFLDVGGSASEEAVTEAFRIILKDSKVEGVLVNIFGGIAKCDVIARAIVTAAKEVGFEVPLVVRLEGTNVNPARKILEGAKADIPTMIVANDLTDAARKVCQAVGVTA